ncbi:ABC transporter permease [Peribacillus sp. SCS-26]|uniref:ABC transporter permease n=1 Tax=Paraperibacillus marinus TaxID=3115295 RepID=UPI0039060F96
MDRMLQKGWRPALAAIVFLLIWEAASRLLSIEEWLLPGPYRIVRTGIEGAGSLGPHLLSTIRLTFTGFLIGALLGLAIAVVLHNSAFLRGIFYPFIILSQNVPVIVLAPLLIIWFGFGILPKLIIISLVCFFPVTVSALDGFRQTPAMYIDYLKMSGAGKKQIFYKAEFPYALPSLFSGLKISATYSVMGAVISEWLGAESGIGVYMTLASSSFRTDRVFAAIFLIMLLSLLFYGLIVILERLIIKWNRKGGSTA